MNIEPPVAPHDRPSARDGGTAVSRTESLRRQAREYTRQWIVHRQGSPAELIARLEEEAGLESISLDLVSHVDARIEDMGRRWRPPRKEAAASEDRPESALDKQPGMT